MVNFFVMACHAQTNYCFSGIDTLSHALRLTFTDGIYAEEELGRKEKGHLKKRKMLLPSSSTVKRHAYELEKFAKDDCLDHAICNDFHEKFKMNCI